MKGLPIGTVRQWKGVRFQKKGEGDWVPVTEGKKDAKDTEGTQEAGKKTDPKKAALTFEKIRNEIRGRDKAHPIQRKEQINNHLDKKGKDLEEQQSKLDETKKYIHRQENIPPDLQKKIERREAGKGRAISLSEKELRTLLDHGIYSLVSAGKNPNNKEDKKLTPEQLSARHEDLKKEMVKLGVAFTEVDGHYGEKEKSLLVMAHDIKEDEATKIGEKFKQDSVIFGEHGKQKMIHTFGEKKGLKYGGEGWSEVREAKDFYTSYKTSDGKEIKFSLNFDFDKHITKAFIVKAERGPRPGHKYLRRYKKGDKWQYVYAEPHRGKRELSHEAHAILQKLAKLGDTQAAELLGTTKDYDQNKIDILFQLHNHGDTIATKELKRLGINPLTAVIESIPEAPKLSLLDTAHAELIEGKITTWLALALEDSGIAKLFAGKKYADTPPGQALARAGITAESLLEDLKNVRTPRELVHRMWVVNSKLKGALTGVPSQTHSGGAQVYAESFLNAFKDKQKALPKEYLATVTTDTPINALPSLDEFVAEVERKKREERERLGILGAEAEKVFSYFGKTSTPESLEKVTKGISKIFGTTFSFDKFVKLLNPVDTSPTITKIETGFLEELRNQGDYESTTGEIDVYFKILEKSSGRRIDDGISRHVRRRPDGSIHWSNGRFGRPENPDLEKFPHMARSLYVGVENFLLEITKDWPETARMNSKITMGAANSGWDDRGYKGAVVWGLHYFNFNSSGSAGDNQEFKRRYNEYLDTRSSMFSNPAELTAIKEKIAQAKTPRDFIRLGFKVTKEQALTLTGKRELDWDYDRKFAKDGYVDIGEIIMVDKRMTYGGENFFNRTTGLEGELNAKRKIYYSTPELLRTESAPLAIVRPVRVPTPTTPTTTRATAPPPSSSRNHGDVLIEIWPSISRTTGRQRLVVSGARKTRLMEQTEPVFMRFIERALAANLLTKSRARKLVESRRTADPNFDTDNRIWRSLSTRRTPPPRNPASPTPPSPSTERGSGRLASPVERTALEVLGFSGSATIAGRFIMDSGGRRHVVRKWESGNWEHFIDGVSVRITNRLEEIVNSLPRTPPTTPDAGLERTMGSVATRTQETRLNSMGFAQSASDNHRFVKETPNGGRYVIRKDSISSEADKWRAFYYDSVGDSSGRIGGNLLPAESLEETLRRVEEDLRTGRGITRSFYVVDDLKKAIGKQKATHKYIKRERKGDHWVYFYHHTKTGEKKEAREDMIQQLKKLVELKDKTAKKYLDDIGFDTAAEIEPEAKPTTTTKKIKQTKKFKVPERTNSQTTGEEVILVSVGQDRYTKRGNRTKGKKSDVAYKSPEVSTANLVGYVAFGKTSVKNQKILNEKLQQCELVLSEMNIKLKTPIDFICQTVGNVEYGTRAQYFPSNKLSNPRINIMKKISFAAKSLMHEIGHGLDYAMIEDLYHAKTQYPGESEALFKELSGVVNSSEYYAAPKREDYTDSASYTKARRWWNSYLTNEKEVFARAFEVYSYAVGKKMVEDGRLDKEFLEGFNPDVFKKINPDVIKINKKIAAQTKVITDLEFKMTTIRREANKVVNAPTPEGARLRESLMPLIDYLNKDSEYKELVKEKEKEMEKRSKLWKNRAKLTKLSETVAAVDEDKDEGEEQEVDEGYLISIPEDKQKEFIDKISPLMEKIFKTNEFKKALKLFFGPRFVIKANPSEKKGIEVESEHTKDKKVALKIARDHLKEDKDYYKDWKEKEKVLFKPKVPKGV